jgi:signal transduction histidine kinase
MSAAAEPGSNRSLLRPLPLFAELREEDLERLCRGARRVSVEPGQVVMEQGTPGDGLYIVVDGELEVIRAAEDGVVPLATRGPGEFVGEMSLLERAPRTATVRALTAAELVVIEPAEFQELIATSPHAATTVLRLMAGRLRSTEASLMEQARLASLGTLAAGLAHELNNPAAAIRRAADHLADSLERLGEAAVEVAQRTPGPDAAAALATLRASVAAPAGSPSDPVEVSAAEDRLADWLDGHGVPDAWALGPRLVAHGLDAERLASLTAGFDAGSLPPVIRWLAASLDARELLTEIRTAATAISEIVGAVRSYVYLDQAPIQDVDVSRTLEDTLVILRHRLRDGVVVQRDFDPSLPRIPAYGSELNQVWTNLIANAVDAMEGRGTLRLTARRERDEVVVRISDTGPGIPEAARARIFDPFFTSKPPGAGTGLGLHIVQNIVVSRHRGRVRVAGTGPDGTTIEVRLPMA